jgi:thiol-disulfide isomerase/thioredoxin
MITVELRRRLLGVAFALSACGPAPALAAEALVPWTGGATPPLKLRTLAGAELSLADFRGRTVIVNFWATWCAPCVAEMPALQRLRDSLASKGVEVIAVNYQENAARIRPFAERLGLTFPIVRDHDGTVREAWQVTVFPKSFVVGPGGRIALVATGEVDWDDPGVESRILSLAVTQFPMRSAAFAPAR